MRPCWWAWTPKAAGAICPRCALWRAIAARLEQLVAAMADALYEGQIPARPLRHGNRLRCAGCDYRPVCRRREGDPFAEMPRGQWKAALAAADEREEATV